MNYLFIGLLLLNIGVFAVCSFWVNKERKEAEKEKAKKEKEEVKKNETKEKINGSNHTDNCSAILDLL